jgi:CRISPR/Cas system-associated endonuclease Cas1
LLRLPLGLPRSLHCAADFRIAHHSDRALCIARELIDRKLAGQEKVVRESLRKPDIAQEIVRWRSGLAEVNTITEVRHIESQAAAEYWSAWRNLPITFPKLDLARGANSILENLFSQAHNV